MSRKAWAYLLAVLLVGAALSGFILLGIVDASLDWTTFVTFTALATVAQLFEAEHGKQSYYPHFVFFFAGMVLLQPALVVLLIIIPHMVEWLKESLTPGARRRKWYIQPFNIAAHIIPALGALTVYNAIVEGIGQINTLAPLLSACAAIAIYIGLNHIMVGMVLVLARGISWRESGVLKLDGLIPDAVMSALGYVVAVLWVINPWLVIPALSPLVLMYQALMVPQLKQDAYTDSKTGLWNARHFATLYSTEMERSKRFGRPLALIMADLDLLRNINNTYGHLAGDAVLEGIGRIIRENVREYDIAGRFGGEEFAIALAETGPEEAAVIAERLREAVEAAEFHVATSSTSLQVTMSLGVASFPEDAYTSNDLIHEADVAVYQAKLNGRNCVVCTADVPRHVKLGIASAGDRLASPFTPTFTPRPTTSEGSGQRAEGSGPELAGSQEPTEATVESYPSISSNAPEQSETDSDHAQPATLAASSGTSAPTIGSHYPSSAEPQQKLKAPVEERRRNPRPRIALLQGFVWSVIVAGVGVTAFGSSVSPRLDVLAIALLTCLAAAAELLQMNVYGENTVSVSVSLAFAAALIGGVPGAACVSAAIALSHFVQRHPPIYKTAFNWAAHLLAGVAPAAVMFAFQAAGMNVHLWVGDLLILAVPVALAAVAYFVIDTGLIASAICLSKGTRLVQTWRENFGWLATHYFVLCVMGLFLSIAYTALGPLGVLVFALPVVMMRFAQKQYVDKTEGSMRELKRMNEQLALANAEVVSAHNTMQQLNEDLFLTLSKIIDARDPYVGNHAAKVADYATAIARELGVSAERMEPLRQAGFLHDIGKIAISEEVLHKPSSLTDEEYEYVKTHAPLGGEFLEMSGALRHLAPFVRHHHERWDGKGYPDKLKGEEIELEARILAVCDAAEAMTSDRPYRRGISLDAVIEEVRRCSGTQFDPSVAAAFALVAEREREKLVSNSATSVVPRHIVTTYKPAHMSETPGAPNAAEIPVAV